MRLPVRHVKSRIANQYLFYRSKFRRFLAPCVVSAFLISIRFRSSTFEHERFPFSNLGRMSSYLSPSHEDKCFESVRAEEQIPSSSPDPIFCSSAPSRNLTFPLALLGEQALQLCSPGRVNSLPYENKSSPLRSLGKQTFLSAFLGEETYQFCSLSTPVYVLLREETFQFRSGGSPCPTREQIFGSQKAVWCSPYHLLALPTR